MSLCKLVMVVVGTGTGLLPTFLLLMAFISSSNISTMVSASREVRPTVRFSAASGSVAVRRGAGFFLVVLLVVNLAIASFFIKKAPFPVRGAIC